MPNKLGFNKSLFILAFDHRASFLKNMFGWEKEAGEEQRQALRGYKGIIYEGFEKGLSLGVPGENAALLVEEEYGEEILADAKNKGYQFILTTEKSGQEEFDFQYGEDFASHIEKYQPAFTKALVRYNPEGDGELNSRQLAKLKILSDYSHSRGYKFLIEPIIPPTKVQLEGFKGDRATYDRQLRPSLSAALVREFQQAGVEPDLWKLEGMERPEDYEMVAAAARSGGRENVSIVVLGRGESGQSVERWLKAGAKASGVAGFAIGRTIFWEALSKFKEGRSSRQQAVEEIARNYLHFYQIFIKERSL